jgi:hypothetical protein
MPNHIKNRITGPAAVISRLCRVDEKQGTCVDFELLIPKPKAISNESIASHVKQAAEIALGLIDFRTRPVPVNLAEVFKSGDYGAAADSLHRSNATRQLMEGPHPKDFNDEEWGAFIGYLTAYRECGGLMDWHSWSCAMWGTKWNAYETELISDTGLEFKHEWADEDTGHNVGHRTYKTDSTFDECEFSGTREGYELAFALRPDIADCYELVGDTYQYREEEEDIE